MLVTGRTVAGATATLEALLAWLPRRDARRTLGVEPLDVVDGRSVAGPWSSRDVGARG